MIEMDKKQLISNWSKLECCLSRMTTFLEGQGVFDETRLPTNAVVAVIASLVAYYALSKQGPLFQWLGLLAGVGSGWLASKGRARREQYEALRQAAELLRSRYRGSEPMGLLPAPG